MRRLLRVLGVAILVLLIFLAGVVTPDVYSYVKHTGVPPRPQKFTPYNFSFRYFDPVGGKAADVEGARSALKELVMGVHYSKVGSVVGMIGLMNYNAGMMHSYNELTSYRDGVMAQYHLEYKITRFHYGSERWGVFFTYDSGGYISDLTVSFR